MPGVVRATQGDHEQALEDYRRAARLMGSHADNASIVEWRELSAWSLSALGRHDEARELAEEAVDRARVWGAPRALGFAMRTLAHLSPRDQAVELLREAISATSRQVASRSVRKAGRMFGSTITSARASRIPQTEHWPWPFASREPFRSPPSMLQRSPRLAKVANFR